MNTLMPDQARVKVWRPDGVAGVEIEIFEQTRGYLDPKTVLDEYHFNVNFAGQARVTYAGARHRFHYTKPLVMVQQPNEVYAADARGEALSGWNLCLHESGMRKVMEALELRDPLPHFPELLVPETINDTLAKQLGETIRAFDLPATRLERESKLLGVMQTFLNHCAGAPLAERRVRQEHRAVQQVEALLHEHFRVEVGLESLAELTGLSRGYLLRTFRDEVGVTPHVYQSVLRIDHAKGSLASGIAISQVAFETGFVDQSHLNRVFKKYVQTTPGRFQRDSLGSGVQTRYGYCWRTQLGTSTTKFLG